MKDEKARALYQKHVSGAYLYRVVPKNQVISYILKGVNPSVDFYKKQQLAIERLFRLVEKTPNFKYKVRWGKWVNQTVVIRTTRRDLQNRWLDFTPSLSNAKYYLKHKGGALCTTIVGLSTQLLKQNKSLSLKDRKIILNLLSWAKKRQKVKSIILKFSATAKCFEHAHFQWFGGEYKLSPFGSFHNFKKAITKTGWDFYEPYLAGKELFYLRVESKIPKHIAVVHK